MKHTSIQSTRPALTLLAMLVVAAPAGAQTAEEQSAYRAMIYTPVAALSPLAPTADTSSRRASGIVLQGRLGHMSRRGGLSLNTMGVGVEVPVGRWNVGGSFAYMGASCSDWWVGDSDCNGDIMVGGSARTTLLMRRMGSASPPVKGRRSTQPSNGGTFVLGFDGSLGFSPRQGEQALAIGAGLPAGILFRSGDVRILPFLTPGVGYGRIGSVSYYGETPTSYGAFAFMVGGGLGLEFGQSGLAANVGFQRVLKSAGGATQLGLGMTWKGATSTR